jgi:pimeloyl-ACP methyl ester carboxylesterase
MLASRSSSRAITRRIVLVPGFWLGAWAWQEVAAELCEQGYEAVALTLPGLDPDDPDRLAVTIDDQARAVLAAVGDEPCAVVAHSGAGLAVSRALDLAPTAVARAIYVDSGPLPDGYVYTPADDPAVRGTEYPLPQWARLREAGVSLDGLDDAALARFRARAVSEPTSVACTALRLADPARRSVPTTVICCSFSAARTRELRDAGTVAMFDELRHVDAEFLDLPTGHWPMWSRPRELAALIAASTAR